MKNITRRLYKIPFLKQNLVFLFSILFCIVIELFRIVYSHSFAYVFLIWNLFLACVPYGFSLFIYKNYRQNPRKYFFVFFALIWLLFYPNAPYIITDFVHLKERQGIPIWYDTLLLFSFAWTGLLLGFASIRLIHVVLENKFGKIAGWLFVLVVIILGSFGIYLGRYLYWNSWDVLQDPQLLFSDIGHRVVNPIQYRATYGLTISFSVFFLHAYTLLVYFMRPNKEGKNLQDD